ncbi:MAG: prepilin peptidase [Candidatus Kerfeldbacteria bacterium CG08_land_8_20_14_0_20_40_16]|uniref:Prepilin peptidase n=1 Tax=Candidatus Kerfeldbacteria bacterium CG08_land_8_20_14_0_20_40_16 TaxID=2014244 RepID=A0A2H0YUY0_9BACT|nr:MAG: prepilin peptidase [Candidatus Kerfeldbacteria bacterium CG08_land_8_20_14_0_20_40_16]
MTVNTIIIFLFGLIIGSFLNSVIFRLHQKRSFLEGRSYCPKCRHQLSVRDLIPVVSFLIQKGKCRYCQKKISWQYPLVELATALVFIALYLNFGLSLKFFIYSLYSFFLIVIFVYDLKYYLVLDGVAIPAILLGFLGSLIIGMSLTKLLIGGIIGLGFFLIQFVVSKGKWIGGGDLRLGLMCGFMVGWPNISLLLFLTYLIGAMVAIALLSLKRKKWGDVLPLGIFISFATMVVLLFGDGIIHWYLDFLT